MTDQDAIARIKPAGLQYWALSGPEFLSSDGQIITSPEAAAKIAGLIARSHRSESRQGVGRLTKILEWKNRRLAAHTPTSFFSTPVRIGFLEGMPVFEPEIATREEVLALLTDQARKGSVTAAAGLGARAQGDGEEAGERG